MIVVIVAATAELSIALLLWLFASIVAFRYKMLRIEQRHASEVKTALTGWSDALHACNDSLRRQYNAVSHL